jgi:hypothetical protein
MGTAARYHQMQRGTKRALLGREQVNAEIYEEATEVIQPPRNR